MKKPVTLLIIVLHYSLPLLSQSGSGTSIDPYRGTLTEDRTWSGEVLYAEDIVIPTGLTLSLAASENGTLLIMNEVEIIGTLIIHPRASLTVNTIINNGTLLLESYQNEGGVASLIHNAYSGTGLTLYRLYLSGGASAGGYHRWHYISMPFNGVEVGTFATLDLARYVELLSTISDNSPCWVAWDGYQYSTGNFLNQFSFSSLEIGRGYNYFSASGTTFSISGTPNISQVAVSMSYSGNSQTQGFNLIGNPFSSCLDWDHLVTELNGNNNVDDAIYFTLNGRFAAYVNQIGTNGATGSIPPLQGFFVKASSIDSDVTITPASRIHNNDQMRYKKGTAKFSEVSDTISYVRLKLNAPGDSSELVVRFNHKATPGFDKEYDAYCFSRNSGSLNLWTTIEGKDFSINGIPFPESVIEIPVGIKISNAGIFELLPGEIRNMDGYSILLTDKYLNASVDLGKGESIYFSSSEGISEGRFSLVFNNLLTYIPEIENSVKRPRIYYTPGSINVIIDNDLVNLLPASVRIYDLSGRRLFRQDRISLMGEGNVTRLTWDNPHSGVYLVEIIVDNYRYIEKIVCLK